MEELRHYENITVTIMNRDNITEIKKQLWGTTILWNDIKENWLNLENRFMDKDKNNR
ncbi:3706_t:CDS:2 [Entrophospora sp. SA101]|nr:3706_t:CDS:2 [Entrophospora sp. SA101]